METDKGKPRSCNNFFRKELFKYYNTEMEMETKNFTQKQENSKNVKFHLFQSIKGIKIPEEILKVTHFYDENYIGNKDFIQIPNLNQVVQNVTNFPMIMASKTDDNGNDEILGVTTIKYENNNNITDNPYFPTQNENVLSITGILTKLNNENNNCRVRNIGKTLFKTAIKGAYDINKNKKVRLICKIDCRNKNSFYGICKAVEELKNEQIDIQLYVVGYYELRNRKNSLKEAPTFVLEVELNKNIKIYDEHINFSYENIENANLLYDLTRVIKNNTCEINEQIRLDKNQIVIYHAIKPINALNVELDVGKSADGNERIPQFVDIYNNLNISQRKESKILIKQPEYAEFKLF